jgi:uncharacterized protein YecE (DUF72 family)
MSNTAAIIYIGTCGYSYPEWEKVFYPPDMKKTEYLRFYSSVFNFVELDFSWYTQPKRENIEKMIEQTPESFRFSVKVNRSLSHNITEEWKKQADIFTEGCAALIEKNRLAAMLLQFPWSFKYTPENRRYLDLLLKKLPGPLCIEFRCRDWFNKAVYEGLAGRNINCVLTDSPEKPAASEISGGTALYRFHGRNKENWYSGEMRKFDYLYSEKELHETVPLIKTAAEKSGILLISFNNHFSGKAVQNAIQLKKILQAEGCSVF